MVDFFAIVRSPLNELVTKTTGRRQQFPGARLVLDVETINSNRKCSVIRPLSSACRESIRLRTIRKSVEEILRGMNQEFDSLYATTGSSI